MAIEINIEGTKEVSKALVEILSPVTEVLGTIGDRVRIYRQLSLMRSLNSAKKIAEEEGLTLKEPPLKFLIPYLEDCSLEQPEDAELIEMWARLLTSAGSKYKSEHNLFIRILREISSSEAKLFEYIASPNTHLHFTGVSHLEDIEINWKNENVHLEIKKCIEENYGSISGITDNDFEKLESIYREKCEAPGVCVYYFEVAQGVRGHYPLDTMYVSPRGDIDDKFETISIAVLKSLGLISEYVSPEIWFENYCFSVSVYYITNLGAHFIASCTKIPSFSNSKR